MDDVDAGIADMNGATAHNEGERRRKEMLDIAFALEARFRVLLPPDRVRKSQSRPAMREDNTITPTTPHFSGTLLPKQRCRGRRKKSFMLTVVIYVKT